MQRQARRPQEWVLFTSMLVMGAGMLTWELASSLAVLGDQGIYSKDRAVEAARAILWENAHRLHKLPIPA